MCTRVFSVEYVHVFMCVYSEAVLAGPCAYWGLGEDLLGSRLGFGARGGLSMAGPSLPARTAPPSQGLAPPGAEHEPRARILPGGGKTCRLLLGAGSSCRTLPAQRPLQMGDSPGRSLSPSPKGWPGPAYALDSSDHWLP